MKVFIYSLNSCGMRNVRISSYHDYIIANGHETVDSPDNADYILIWTCAFRNDMRDNSVSEIIRYSENYNGEVIVCGCLPDIDREFLNNHFKGKIITWRNDEDLIKEFFSSKLLLSEMPLVLHKEQLYEDEALYRKENPEADVPYVGRYVQIYISEGCPWKCTYCSERLAFPPFKSYPEANIIDSAIKEFKKNGRKKFVLQADSIGDYGTDTNSSLIELIYKLKSVIPEIHIALQQFNPYHFLKFYDDMIKLIKDGTFVHFQLPYQSANDRILKLMERPYNKADIEKVFSTLNRLNFKETDSHIIVGFPSETNEEFEESVHFAIKHHIKYMLVNGFMETKGMEAEKIIPKIDTDTKKKRMTYANQQFEEAKIISNCDYSFLAEERFKKMNNF